jgi:hypothetical protein
MRLDQRPHHTPHQQPQWMPFPPPPPVGPTRRNTAEWWLIGVVVVMVLAVAAFGAVWLTSLATKDVTTGGTVETYTSVQAQPTTPADNGVPNPNPVRRDSTPVPVGGAGVTISPGTPIGQNASIGGGCTVGFVGQVSGGKAFAVTAGHCVTGASPVWVSPYSGAQTSDWQHLAQYRVWQPEPHDFTQPGDTFGFAVLELAPDVALSSKTPHGTVSGVGKVKPGDEVCRIGWTSGFRCGTVTSVNERQIGIDGLYVEPGDSGGPVFTRDGLALVGITVSDDGSGHATAAPISALLANVRAHYDASATVLTGR